MVASGTIREVGGTEGDRQKSLAQSFNLDCRFTMFLCL